MAEVIRRKKSDGILIVAHRRELLDQIQGTVGYFGIDMVKSHIVVESIQKLSRDLDHTEITETAENLSTTNSTNYSDFEPSLIIIDEAHHALAKTYRMLWER